MSENPTNPSSTLYCYNHPSQETMLRCNKCERPICGECAVLTPTGYRCKECVRGQQKRFENAHSLDYVLGLIVAGALSLAGSFIPAILSFFTIFVAPIIGVIIVAVVQRVIKHRRSQSLFIIVAGAAALGSLPLLILQILSIFNVASFFGFGASGWLGLIWQGLYTFLVTTTVYYRMTGIQL
jgi:hypothetical protein